MVSKMITVGSVQCYFNALQCNYGRSLDSLGGRASRQADGGGDSRQ